ncbi:MAG: hypothetical protein E7504_07495 [Ruminococcus sp.]|nr:hypothetical protein [Ruminococcus sp.]
MDENSKIPAGWGDTEDEEDYVFPEEDDAPWGAAASSDDAAESDDTETPEAFDSAKPADSVVSRQNISPPKKSYVPLIIGIAAVVMIAGVGGVFGGIMLSKDRGNPEEQKTTAETEMTVSSETDHVSMETVAESISETEMMQQDTQAETHSTAEVPYKVYEESAIRTLDGFLESYWLGPADAPYYLDNVMYSLIDVNEDGVPELLTSYPTEASDTSSLYIYDGGDYRKYDALTWGNARVCVSAHLIELRSYEGAEVRTIYEMDAQGNVSLKDVIFYDYDGNFMCNGEKISSGEYDALQRSYDSLQWENIARYERKRSGTEHVETTKPSEETLQTETTSQEQTTLPSNNDSDNGAMYSAYAEIASEYESEISLSGLYLVDLNGDGQDEMILPDADSYEFYLYEYVDGTMYTRSFGSWQALGNFVLYTVSGDGGAKYVYYRDQYSYISLQGYYHPSTESSLYICIDYPSEGEQYYADWCINYENPSQKAEVSRGYEPVETFYAQPTQCHDALLSAFSTCGFAIREESKYTKMIPISLNELQEKANKIN